MGAALAASLTLPAVASAAERRYSATDFDRVRVIGASDVTVGRGRATSVSASGSPDALDDLVIEVVDRELVIQPRARVASTWSGGPARAARITVTTPLLRAVRVSGSARMTVAGLSTADASIGLTGSGNIDISGLQADRVSMALTGAGTITAAGRVKTLTLSSRGSGTIEASTLMVDDLTLTAATSGDVRIAADRSAKVTASGSGTVSVLGKPACTVSNPGSGTVSCGAARLDAAP